MRLRASFLVLVLMGLALVAFAPAAAVGTTEQFSGDLAGGCGPLHTYAVPAGTTTIDVVATADNPANDITVDLIDPTGKVVVHGDTLTSPETAHYQSDSLQAGDWSAKVCLFAGGGHPLPPTTYHGTFTTSDAPVLPGIPGAGTGKTTGTPTPTYTGGSLNFAPATVVDPQRTEGEPLTWTDKNGAIWESGPWGTTTQNSFVHRSTDGGLTYHIVSPVQLRPDAGPGGGDTDIVTDDQGYAYFVDLEALVNLGTSVSNDKGNTWRKNPTAVQNAAVDRQWFAVDNGSSPGPEDNTVFLAFHESSVGTFIYSSPGSTGSTDPVGGLVWSNSSANAPIPIASDATCAQLRFDPVKRNLYYACNEGTHVRVSVGHVDVGQRTNIAYKNVTVPDSPGKGSVGHLFPAIAVDGVGNVYVAWIDEKDNNVYYSMSTDGAKSWTSPVKVNGGESVTNEFLWAQASGTGNLVLGWIGTAKTSPTGPDGMPAWSSDPAGATHYPWYGYVATFTGANTFSPTIAQQRFTEKPMHFGQICNNGIGCSTGGDRTMADYFGFNYDANGLLHIVFDDTTTPLHGAHLYEVRQLADKAPSNPVDDATGDAQWPHYGPAAAGSTLADLDLTGVRLSPGPNGALRVQISAADLSSLAPPAGKSSAAWLVRFQAASTDAGGVTSYPIFYAGAQSTGGGPLSYFAGTATCTNSTPGTCKVVEYPATNAATGTLCGNTITIDVPTASGFGAALSGSTLYSVTGFAFGRNADAADLYADVDSTPSFDYSVGTGTPVSCTGTPGNGGGNGNGNGGGGNGGGGNTGGGNNGGGGGTGGGGATGGGTTGGGTTGGVLGTNKSRAVHSAKGRGVVHLAGRTRKGALAVSLQGTRGVLRFLDRSRNLRARSLGRLGVAYHGKSVRVVGIARLGKRKVPFVAVLVDRGRRDTFTLRLGTKYRYSGRFVRGNLSIS